MPRTTDPTFVRRWAKLAVQEKTIAEIRKDHWERTGEPVDPRTIERALERTRAEIAERTATAAELQRGIRVHGEQLLASVDPLMKAVRSAISGRLNPRPTYAIDATLVTVGGAVGAKRGDLWQVQIKDEKAIELRLLQQHLPYDKAWQRLEKFSKSTANWVAARISFASEIKQKLTQVAISRDASGPATEVTLEQAGLAVIDAGASVARINGKRGIDDLLESLVIDPKSGDVRVGSTKLSSLEEGELDNFRTAISKGVKAIMKSDVGRDVMTTRTAFDRAGSNLVDELATLRLATYLPGACKTCKRFRL